MFVLTEEGSPSLQLSKDQLKQVAEQLGSKWAELGEKLGVPHDDITYFKDSYPDTVEAAVSMMTVWQVN